MADNDTYELFEEAPADSATPAPKQEFYSVSADVPVPAPAPEADAPAEEAPAAEAPASPDASGTPAPVFDPAPAKPAATPASEGEGFKSGAFRAKEIPEEAIKVHDVPGDVDLATYLRTLRVENGLTLDALAQCTGISKNYLAALESDDLAELPPIAYALAYVRRLGSLYRVPEERIPLLTQALRNRLEPELPEDMSKSIVDHAESEENVRRIRQLALILGTAGILLAVALILGGLLLWAGIRRHNATRNQPFHRPMLVEVQGEPKLQVPLPAIPSR